MKSAPPVLPLPARSTVRRLLPIWVALAAVSAVAVFLLPRLLPTAPSISDSYIFGFNNRVSILLLLASLVACGYLGSLSRPLFEPAAAAVKIPPFLVRRWMLLYAAGWAFMYFLVRGLSGFVESAYLIDRLRRLDAGGVPYRDFEFAYGAMFLYGPRALQYLSLSAEAAYYTFWLLALLAGVWMLAQTLNLLDYPSSRRSDIFSLLCITGIMAVLNTGLNYTFFRFVPASYFALLVQKVYTRGEGRYGPVAMSLAVLSFVVVLSISPEMGLAFGAGITAYLGYFEFRQGSLRIPARFAAYIGFVLANLGVVWCAARLHVFSTLLQFSHGAYSFPILPAPHILIFFFLCALAAIFAAGRLRSHSKGEGPLIVLSVSAGALFAALGRCDPGHVFFAGIGILLVSLLLASNMPRIWKPCRLAFVIFFIAAPAFGAVWSYQRLLTKACLLRVFESESSASQTRFDSFAERMMAKKLGEAKAVAKFNLLKKASVLPPDIDLLGTYPQARQVLQAPFGFSPNRFGSYPSSLIDFGYFYQLTNAFTPDAVTRKIAELKAHPRRSLLLPDDFNDQCGIDPDGDQQLIRILFVYPFYETAVHDDDAVWQPICTYINQHYEVEVLPTLATYDYGVWKPRSAAAN